VDPMFFKKMGKVADRKHNVRVIDSSELDEWTKHTPEIYEKVIEAIRMFDSGTVKLEIWYKGHGHWLVIGYGVELKWRIYVVTLWENHRIGLMMNLDT
jgi:hypothetical protein